MSPLLTRSHLPSLKASLDLFGNLSFLTGSLTSDGVTVGSPSHSATPVPRSSSSLCSPFYGFLDSEGECLFLSHGVLFPCETVQVARWSTGVGNVWLSDNTRSSVGCFARTGLLPVPVSQFWRLFKVGVGCFWFLPNRRLVFFWRLLLPLLLPHLGVFRSDVLARPGPLLF